MGRAVRAGGVPNEAGAAGALGHEFALARECSGRVILVLSIAGLRGNSAIGLYGIAKAGLSQLVRNLAVEWGLSGVNVNSVDSGLIETPLSAYLLNNNEFMALTSLKRMGQPEG